MLCGVKTDRPFGLVSISIELCFVVFCNLFHQKLSIYRNVKQLRCTLFQNIVKSTSTCSHRQLNSTQLQRVNWRKKEKNINTDTQWRSMTFIFSHFCCLLLWLIALQLWFVFHCIDILHAAQRSPFGVRARAPAKWKCNRKWMKSDLLFIANIYSNNQFWFFSSVELEKRSSDRLRFLRIVQGLFYCQDAVLEVETFVWVRSRMRIELDWKMETNWNSTNSLRGNWQSHNVVYRFRYSVIIIKCVLVCESMKLLFIDYHVAMSRIDSRDIKLKSHLIHFTIIVSLNRWVHPFPLLFVPSRALR